uniref:Uncharacterized protein n=1 Tax=Ananas comosus var. bracteatus TaxID=296719 RepID=A0A6V7PGS1_ANACO|nr:unnamed protein product [Ananas comosus var. bracteatus]
MKLGRVLASVTVCLLNPTLIQWMQINTYLLLKIYPPLKIIYLQMDPMQQSPRQELKKILNLLLIIIGTTLRTVFASLVRVPQWPAVLRKVSTASGTQEPISESLIARDSFAFHDHQRSDPPQEGVLFRKSGWMCQPVSLAVRTGLYAAYEPSGQNWVPSGQNWFFLYSCPATIVDIHVKAIAIG